MALRVAECLVATTRSRDGVAGMRRSRTHLTPNKGTRHESSTLCLPVLLQLMRACFRELFGISRSNHASSPHLPNPHHADPSHPSVT
jgi:hypothetical protein